VTTYDNTLNEIVLFTNNRALKLCKGNDI